MDKRLYDIFSEDTEVPECVRNRIEDTLKGLEQENVTYLPQKIKTRKRRNWKRSLLFSFAAVMAFGATVFAAEKYIGISDFFKQVGAEMPKEAENLVETQPVQQEDGDSIVTYTVKEALCDKNSVQVVMEVTAKERGKYLLVGQDLCDEDPVRNLGIESDKTVGEYAQEKGLTPVRIGASFDFDSDLGIDGAAGDYRSVEDDVLDVYTSAAKTNQSANLTVSCIGTAVLPDAKSVDDVMRTNITFQMEDKSQGRSVTYVPEDGSEGILAADGKIKILSVDIEESEIGEYVTVHYIPLEGAENMSIDVTDTDGTLWKLSTLGGYAPAPTSGQESTWNLAYQKTTLPDKIGLRLYNTETDNKYEPVIMEMQK